MAESESENQAHRFGRYELIARLAAGGMGEVFRAKVTGVEGFQKPIALKRIYPHLSLDETYRTLFIQEAKVTANLVHPNIVQVYDLGEESGQLFIAMEFVKGADLSQICEWLGVHGTTLPADIASVVAFDTLEALDFAHNLIDEDGNQLELVHRDISPQNVLVSFTNGFAKLCDFGVARATTGSGDFLDGKLVGKFRYMSPEHARGVQVDARADLYSLAVVIVEAVTGEPYMDDTETGELVTRLADGDTPRLSDIAPELPEYFLEIFDRALEPEREDRYQTAAEFRDAVEDFLSYCDPRDARYQLRDLAQHAHGHNRAEAQSVQTDGPGDESERWTQLVNRAHLGTQVVEKIAPGPGVDSIDIDVVEDTQGDGEFTEKTVKMGPSAVKAILAKLEDHRKNAGMDYLEEQETDVDQVAEGSARIDDFIDEELDAVDGGVGEPEYFDDVETTDAAPPPAPNMRWDDDDDADFKQESTRRRLSSAKAETPIRGTPRPVRKGVRGGVWLLAICFLVGAGATAWFLLGNPDEVVDGPEVTQPENPRKGKRKGKAKGKVEYGFLSLNVRPQRGAKVFINGEALSKRLPLKKHPLSAGKHNVMVRGPRGKPRKFTIQIQPGQTLVKTIKL